MPRPAKLGRLNGYWYTRAGTQSGVFFGKIGEVPYKEATKKFRKYLASLNDNRKQIALPKLSVAEVCDAHLLWVEEHRSATTFRQRRCILEMFCSHVVDKHRKEKLLGHGQQIATLRSAVFMRRHVEQYLYHRKNTPSKKTGKPVGDKSLRAIVVAVKACWNWAADSVEDGGGGLFDEDHRPLAKLPRGYVAPKDLTEEDLPTDEEIATLLRWGAVEPSQIRIDGYPWRPRRADEYYTHDSRVFVDMLRVYHATGPRTSELCVAQVRDFMPRTSQLCLGKHKRSQTQHNPTVRTIQINKEIVGILVRNAEGKTPREPLFTHEDGTAWNTNQVTKRLNKIIELAGEHDQHVRTHITPYSFRDLYISELLMIGTEPFKVAKMAGTSLREIERTYGHFFNEDLATAQAQLMETRDRRKKNAKM